MGMSSVKQDVWFGWNVKNFAQNLLIGPGSTWRGLIDSELRGCHLYVGREGRGGGVN